RRRRNRFFNEWHQVFSQCRRITIGLYLFAARKQAEQIRAGLHNEYIRLNRGEEVVQLGNSMRCRAMTARCSVSIAQFLDGVRIRPRFDAPVTTMRLNVREWFLFQPAQWIRGARA